MNAHDAIEHLAARNRVVLLGGIAVIAHGLPSATQDVAIWLDPRGDVLAWADSLRYFLQSNGLTAARVAAEGSLFRAIAPADIERVATDDSFVRVLGAGRPIDVFRTPRNFDPSDFDAVWSRARPLDGGTRLLDEIDLMLTKLDTGRAHDEADVRFLERKATTSYRERLTGATYEEAIRLLDRFATPEVLASAAVEARDARVRERAETLLTAMATAGDPYALEFVANLQNRKTHRDNGHGR